MKKSQFLRNVLLVGLSLSIISLSVSCGNGNSTDTTSESQDESQEFKTTINNSEDEEKVFKQDMNVALTAQPPTLDPFMTVSTVALEIDNNVFETLYAFNENYEPVPVLAESVDISEDGKTYTFKLRQNVEFHNGKIMTADDVNSSMNHWLTSSSRAKTLFEGATFNKIDENTVEFVLPEAYGDTLELLCMYSQMPTIMPLEVIEGADETGVKEFIGTGPYKFVEWKQDQYIKLTRFDEYQSSEEAPSGFIGEKEAKTENLIFHFVPDETTRIAGVQTGEYDVAESILPESYESLKNDESIELLTKPSSSLNLYMNVNEGVFTELDARQGLLAVLNDDEIMLPSNGDPTLYSMNCGYMNPEQPQWASTAGEEYYNQNDPEKAKELFAKVEQSAPIKILTTKDYPSMYSSSVVLNEQLRQIGVESELVVYDFPTFMEKKEDYSQWDILITSNTYHITPVLILPVTPSWVGNDDPKISELVKKIRLSDTEEAKATWDELQLYLYEQGYSTPLGHSMSTMIVSDKVNDITLFDYPVLWNATVEQ